MRILTPSGARHFCRNFSTAAATKSMDISKYLDNLKPSKPFSEGTNAFSDLRDCLLRDAERFAFLAASNYASTFRSLQAAAAPWTGVGFYYSTFFSARSLLAMHGAWIDGAKRWIDVTNINPGSIELTYKRTRHPATQQNLGSHKAFWNVFYNAARNLTQYADPAHAYALSPIQSSNTWLIDNRNSINYKSSVAVDLVNEFLMRFDHANVSQSLPGTLKVYKNISESMLALVCQFRNSNNLVTDIAIGGYPNLNDAVDNLIKTNRPAEIDAFCGVEITEFLY